MYYIFYYPGVYILVDSIEQGYFYQLWIIDHTGLVVNLEKVEIFLI
jgi:hypothetical protein